MGDFNPRNHLKKIKGKGDANAVDYLPPKWRVKWFREDHPDGSILTEIVHFDEKVAVVKCTVTTPDGTMCVSHGHETAADHADYLMKAETKSIGRCLAIRGYGIEFSEEDDDKEEADPRDYKSLPAPTEVPGPAKDTQWFKKKGNGATPEPAPQPEAAAAETPLQGWAAHFVRHAMAGTQPAVSPEERGQMLGDATEVLTKLGLSPEQREQLWRTLYKATGKTQAKGRLSDALPAGLIRAVRDADDAQMEQLGKLGREGN